MNSPLQQTKIWQNFLNTLGETTFFEETNDYIILAIEKKTRFGNYLYLPYGPYIKTKNGAKTAYEALESLGRSKNIIFMRIEPQDAERAEFLLNLPNCVKSRNLSPEETWILDISAKISEIYASMKQNTRNLCKNYQKKGISVSSTKNPENIKHLVALQQKITKKNNFNGFSEKYLKTELEQDFSTLYLAAYDGKVIASSLFFDYDDTRFYIQSASDPEYRKLPATYGIINEAILDAKRKNLKNFDFWGIAPENAGKDHPWAGFTSFKKSFGGRAVKYAGTYDLVFSPVKYRFYSLARRGNLFLRKTTRKIKNR